MKRHEAGVKLFIKEVRWKFQAFQQPSCLETDEKSRQMKNLDTQFDLDRSVNNGDNSYSD